MDWGIGPFELSSGPLLQADPSLSFRCPVTGDQVAWAAKDVFNPGAVVRDGQVCLLVRAEDEVGPYAGTSRLGLATSADGLDLTLEPTPVLAPDARYRELEWPGGCEDPRVVESPDGGYVCLYTGFEGRRPILMVATSPDLRSWTKHGPAFGGTPYQRRSSKSGAVVTAVRDGRLVATPVGGRFWMYWGERTCFAATSPDLVRWTPVDFDATGDRELGVDPRMPGTMPRSRISSPRVSITTMMTGWPTMRRSSSRSTTRPKPNMIAAASGMAIQT